MVGWGCLWVALFLGDCMSVMYCEQCDINIDTDYDVEHFDEHELEKIRERKKEILREIVMNKLQLDGIKEWLDLCARERELE